MIINSSKKKNFKIDSSDDQELVSDQKYKALINSSSDEERKPQFFSQKKKKRKAKTKTSQVWTHFNRINGQDICKLCETKYISFTSTTNLQDHLKSDHPKQYKKLYGEENASEGQIQSYFKQKITKLQQENLNELIAIFISSESRSYSLVSSPYFIRIIHFFSDAAIPSNVSMANTHIPNLYEKIKSKIILEIKEQKQYSLSLTCDTWSSISNKSFITFTCHYIDNNYQLQSRVLTTKEIFSQTSESIAKELISVLDEYNIQNNFNLENTQDNNKMQSEKQNMSNQNQIFIITDRATNNIKAFGSDLIVPHFYCIAHQLHTILGSLSQSTNNEYEQIMNKVRSISKYFRGSPQKNNKLIEIQINSIQQQKIKATKSSTKINKSTSIESQLEKFEAVEEGNNENEIIKALKLKIDLPTCWNSSYIMLERFDKLSTSIQQYFILNNQDNILIKDLDFQNVTILKSFLSPFYEITQVLCTRDGCCISKILKLISTIRTTYLKIKEDDKEFIIALKQDLLEVFNNKINLSLFQRNELDYYLITSFLNPKTKDLSFLDEQQKQKTMELIENECQKLQLTKSSLKQNNQKQQPLTNSFKVDIFGLPIEDEEVQDTELFYGQEIQNYILFKCIKQLPILEWWKQNSNIFPNLSNIARRYLNIQVTSVESERVFSKSGQIVNNKRASLNSLHVNQLTFISFNSKFYDF